MFAVLQRHATALRSIFNAYAASSLDGSDCDMDADEFRDVVFDCGLPTSSYGVEVMLGELSKANAGSGDSVLVFHEFVQQRFDPAIVLYPEWTTGGGI